MKRTKPHPTLDEWWENAIPPGADATRELRFVIVGMLLSLVISCYFFLNYAASYRKLFETVDAVRVLKENAIMTDFSVLTEDIYLGFYVLAACQLFVAIYHVAYFYMGHSKSIYLMRRLPSPTALPRRILTVPITVAAICLVSVFMLNLIYYAVYYFVTPTVCLP
ncbi:MAG: hypothetical protein IJV98_06205 [Clostridia bacterium]|nr:hypothetical protein [Clostridia bacterium]